MKKLSKQLGLLAILTVGIAGRAMAAESLWDDFESYSVGTNLSSLSAQGWGASDVGVIVTTNLLGNATQFAELPPYVVATNVKPAGLAGKVWTDCAVNETMRIDPASLSLTSTPATVVMVGVTTDGYAVVYNAASNGWDVCTNDARGTYLGAGVAAEAWVQLSVCQDFERTNVAVFLNGRLLRQKLPFITVPASYSGLRFKSGVGSTGYVDNVYVSNSIPTALMGTVTSTNDINGDGMPDAQELVQYGGLAKMVPGDFATITGAVAAATAGDRIVVSNATYEGLIALSNGVTLIGTNMTVNPGNTNLTINGGMTVVQTGMVYSAGAPGQLTVTGTVSIAAGGLLTISNTAANFGGLTIGGGGLLHVVNGALIVGSYTNAANDFTLSLITNVVSSTGTGSGTISPSGTSTMISTWSNVTYTLTANKGSVVGSLTNNGVVTNFIDGTKTATYTDPAANITNNQTIVAAFVYNGIRYVPGDYTTLSNALAAATANDQIVVSDGTYAETLVVSNNVTLVGTNVIGLASLTVLSNQTAVLSGFTTFSVTNLVIQSNATVVVSNSTLTANGMTLTGTFTLDSGWGGSLTPSSLNYTNDFESYPTNMPLALCGGQGWGASDSGSIIQGSVFTNGAKAAMVMQHSALSNTVSAGDVNKVWTDIWLNDSAARVSGFPYLSTNANRAVMLFVNTNNNIVIWNSNAWDECVSNALGGLAPTVATGTWVRVSVFEDFTAQKVALFVNGQLLRQQVPFMSPMASYKGLSLSAGAGSAYMDDVSIWTNMPASLTNYDQSVNDLNHDGIADAVQISQNGFTYNPPMMAAPTVSAVGTNSATVNGSVTNDGGTVVTSWGTAWDTNLNPTAHLATILGSANAPFNFSTNVAGFSPGQHYYVRGWASNVAGIAYSPNGEFYAEPVQASAITFIPVPGGFTIGWTADVTSTGTVVLVKQGAPVDAAPEDGSNYVATAFGSGAYLGVSNYIVYVGSGSNVTVNNLIYGSNYQVAAFAYAGHDNLIQYRTNSPPTCILVWPPRGSVYTIR